MNVFDLEAVISLNTKDYENNLKKAGSQMKAVGDKLSAVGKGFTKYVTGPIVALGTFSIKAFNEVKDGLNIVTQKTGATGQELEAMHQSVKNLASEIPASFEQIGTAIGEVNTRFGVTGQELEDLSGQFVKFAKVNNTDVNNSIDTVQKALANFGLDASHTSDLLDTMTKVGQDTGVSMETLMNGLVQNGAAFQELGLSIDQSVALMGKLDKSGANSESVMQGLRKALKNAAKDGKPLNEALSDLQDTILNGKDGMDGLTAAYELFGRSGDQIYGAVKNGTINFKELGAAAADASGVLDRTFEATLTPAEKFQTTLNSLKTTGYEFGNTVLGMITPALDKGSKKIQELSKKWQSMDKGTKESIIKFAGFAAAIGPVLMVTGKLITSVGAITKAFGGLFKLIATNPVGALVTATAALGVALYASHEAGQKALEAQYGLNEEQQKSIDTINGVTDAYNEATKARNEATASIQADAQYSHDLVDEYNSLIDANGQVKAGYEARAEFIKGQLAESLGVEKGKIEELIGANGQLDSSIHQLIETKKAEAILDANKDMYTEAIKNRKNAVEQLGPALQTLAQQEQVVNDASQRVADAQKRYDKALAEGDPHRIAFKNQLSNAQAALDAAGGSYDKAKKDVDGYTETLRKSGEEIKNYEGLSTALIEGDIDAVNQWTTTLTEGIKTRTNATQTELQEQARIITEQYNAIKAAYDAGQAGITSEMVDEAYKRMQTAQTEAGSVGASSQKEASSVKTNLSSAQTSASGSFSKIQSDAKTYMQGATTAVETEATNIKGKFPISLGKLFTGTLTTIAAKITDAANEKRVSYTTGVQEFAKAMNQPYMFTKPTFFDYDKIAGEAGPEILYGRNSLMKDIKEAVGGSNGSTYTFNIYATPNQSPREIANAVQKILVSEEKRRKAAWA